MEQSHFEGPGRPARRTEPAAMICKTSSEPHYVKSLIDLTAEPRICKNVSLSLPGMLFPNSIPGHFVNVFIFFKFLHIRQKWERESSFTAGKGLSSLMI